MNKQKDRLVELLQEASTEAGKHFRETTKKVLAEKGRFNSATDIDHRNIYEVEADYILADGWMRPPVKVGQLFWHIEEYIHELLPDEYPTVKVVCESKVEKIFIEKYGNSFGDTRKSFSFHDIGKTVFLAKEEAENALGGVQG